jgi:hypothetical protein
MKLEELRSRVEAGEIDTVLIALCDMQGRLQGKRLTARHFLEEVVEHGAEGCSYLLAVDVEMNTVDGYAMSSWERGYGDFVLAPDLSSLRPVPWQEGTAMVLCDLAWEDGSDVVASPRQILRRQLARLAERGWSANAGTELVPHPLLAGRRRRAQCLCRRPGSVRVVPGRTARLPAGADRAGGAQHQFLQALREGLVRAHHGRLGPGQPDVRAARGRPRPEAALRVARRRL